MLDRYGTIWYDVNKCTVPRYDIYCNCAVGLLWGEEEGCILVLGGGRGGGTQTLAGKAILQYYDTTNR